MNTMEIWNKLRTPPPSALKKIEAGRLKGKSDISPQWRYQIMTETFGMVGEGWKFTIDKTWTEPAANGETMVFVQVSVYVKVVEKWSEAIPGLGGSTLVVSEKNGMYNDDDGYKKAVTDALSTALKMLGVAADVYLGLSSESKNQKPVNNNDDEIVTDKTWAAWLDLLKEADTLRIPHINLDRKVVKKSDLIATAKELREIVNNAKAQAKAGE